MSENMNRELGWNDEISNDGSEFIMLPEGDYDFEVIKFERSRTRGSDKLPPCNMAVLTIEVGGDQAAAQIKHHLVLHTKLEWKLCEFFIAIGARQHGEKVTMDWNKVVGAVGRCKVGIREWTKDNGEAAQSNEILKFYEPDPAQAPASKPAPASGKTYQEGMF